MASTTSISGLASGIDWQSMISQMMAVERQPETLMTAQKTTLDNQYNEWTTINTKLAALQTSASALATLDDFNLYTSNASATGTTTDVSKLASFTVGTNASPGSYSLTINNLAQAQKLGSEYFNSLSDGLNISGDLVINGHTVNIVTTDSLTTIQNKINALNSGSNPAGVIASIITVAPGQYQLTLTSQNTGKNGMVLSNGAAADGSAANVLGELGLADSSTSIRNAFTGGALSSAFSSSTQSIQSLLGLTNGASGTVKIGGQDVSIDLSSDQTADSLESINEKINAAGVTAGFSSSIVSKTDSSGNTTYTLQINGTQSFTDASNILQTLGILEQGSSGNSDVYGAVGDTQNTTGGTAITNDTLLKNIDGYSNWTSADTIAINDANSPSIDTTFNVTANSTVGDLLTAIDSAYGNQVSAYVNSNGAIVVEDNRSSGTSNLDLSLTPTNTSLNLGTFSDITKTRSRQIVAGADASITLDGNTITRSTNQISDVIAGTTISLVGADKTSTITLNITPDTSGIESKITDFVTKYNDLMTEISNQFTYSQDTSSSSSTTTTITTPPLFGDSTLQSIKGTIRNTILSGVSGVNSTLDHLSLVGINIDETGQLSIDSTKLEGYLSTNFNDVANLFVAQGTSTNSNLTYIGSGDNTAAGAYQVHIIQAASKASITGSELTDPLSQATNLTITDSSGSKAQISLSKDSDISTIVDAINSELSKQYQQILVGANQLYTAGKAGFISADTNLNNIYDANGNPVALADGDKISFTGTNRIGSAVTGSFTISDTSTQTVGDLINSINNAYGTGYSASIDSQGRITITDLTAGNSQLALNITADNLDFGAIGVNPTAGDGSQSGRYALGITAENDGNKLELVNNDYGDHNFSVTSTGQDLGIAGTSSGGSDVAGEIRLGSGAWMTMTGSGQTLTADANQSVAGLAVEYTGTSAGVNSDNTNTFGFTFTKGVGNVLSSALEQMSDPISGYVSEKEQALQTQMSTIDKNISDMEERITQDQAAMTQKYVQMEALISQLQSQSSWLTSQINSLTSSSS